MSTERLVALDIGTRSVIGLVLEKSDSAYKITGVAVAEHDHRTMFDGQIHDIPKVSAIVSDVINSLEEQTGETITEVAVAAAGRALVTIKGSSKFEHDLHQISKDEIVALELQAVQAAQKMMVSGESKINGECHCVGYTVLNYYLDGNIIKNLLNQTGQIIEVDVIATFLPRVVVDSLITVLDNCNLKIKSLTLEPMAAAEIAIPESMRQLNLALVDIGAGTSDIAITANGRLAAYGMVPFAGDEITDKIAESYLLDFTTAEKVKRNLNKKEVKFKDILGNTHSKIPTEDIKHTIEDTIKELTQKISNTILDLNSKPPHAIISIGGGSLTPNIAEKIASAIDLPPTRVGIAGRDIIHNIAELGKEVYKKISPQQLITPLGIGINSFNNLCLTYCETTINDTPIRLLAIKELTVADALIEAGIDLKKLIGKPGKALTVEINGEVTFLRGQPGTPSKIMLNNKIAKIDAPISHGDKITFIPAQDGSDCQISFHDLLEMNTYQLLVNGNKVLITPRIYVNDQVVSKDSKIKENSKITIVPVKIKDVISNTQYEFESIEWVKLNDQKTTWETSVKNGDKIEIFLKRKPQQHTIQVTINNQPTSFTWDKNTTPMLLDILPLAKIDLKNKVANKKLVMKVNGKEAGFTTQLKAHDQIDLSWE